MKLFLLLLLTSLSGILIGNAQGIKGTITDESGAPIPFANIFVQRLGTGASSNIDGIYQLNLPPGNWDISFRYIGYQVYNTQVEIGNSEKELNVTLKTQHYQIPEIKVMASGEDPAYYIMRRAIAMAPYYQKQVSKYSCKVYLKGTSVFKKIPKLLKKAAKEDGVQENDPEVTETIAKVDFELPDIFKQEIIAMRSSGKQSMTSPMPYITNNLYDAEKYGVVSPIGKNALKTYDFKLVGVFEENGRLINKIKLEPKQKSKDTFSGFIYITDGFWNIYSAELSLSVLMIDVSFNQIYSEVANNAWMPVNMDFDMDISIMGVNAGYKYVASISDYKVTLNPAIDHSFLDVEKETIRKEQLLIDSIQQETVDLLAAENNRKEMDELLQSENLNNRKTKKLSKLIKKEVSKDSPPEPLEIKSQFIYDQRKTRNDSAYWSAIRPVPLTSIETVSFSNKDSFLIVSAKPEYKDSVRNVKRGFKIAHLAGGHTYDYSIDSIHKKESLKFSGLFNVFSIGHNTVEGMQIPVSFSYYKSDSTGKAWELSPKFKYSFSRKMIDSDIQFRKRLNGISHSVLKVGLGSNVVDFNESSSFSETINAAYILYFEQNFKKYYHRNYFKVGYEQDVTNGFKAGLSFLYRDSRAEINRTDFKFINHENRVFSPNIPDNPEIGNDLFIKRQEAILDLALEYTPRHRYYIRNHVKRYVESKYPTFTFNYKKSIPNLLKTDGNFDFTEFGIRQQLGFGISERFNYQINTGFFLNNKKVFFESYRHFDTYRTTLGLGNLANTFRLLPFYQFSSSKRFLEGHASWDSRKLLIKQLPLIGNTSIVENVYFNYLSTDRLQNYCEIGYGLKNIFMFGNIEAVAGFKNGKYDSVGIKLYLNMP